MTAKALNFRKKINSVARGGQRVITDENPARRAALYDQIALKSTSLRHKINKLKYKQETITTLTTKGQRQETHNSQESMTELVRPSVD